MAHSHQISEYVVYSERRKGFPRRDEYLRREGFSREIKHVLKSQLDSCEFLEEEEGRVCFDRWRWGEEGFEKIEMSYGFLTLVK